MSYQLNVSLCLAAEELDMSQDFFPHSHIPGKFALVIQRRLETETSFSESPPRRTKQTKEL